MAEDPIAREALHLSRRVVQDADRDLRHAPAALAADVLVVIVAELEARVAFAEVDAVDETLPLEQADRPED